MDGGTSLTKKYRTEAGRHRPSSHLLARALHHHPLSYLRHLPGFSRVPHFMQKWLPGALGLPQLGQ